MSKSSSRRATPRSGTGRSRKSNAPGLDIMERDMRRAKLKNEQLKVELEKVQPLVVMDLADGVLYMYTSV